MNGADRRRSQSSETPVAGSCASGATVRSPSMAKSVSILLVELAHHAPNAAFDRRTLGHGASIDALEIPCMPGPSSRTPSWRFDPQHADERSPAMRLKPLYAAADAMMSAALLAGTCESATTRVTRVPRVGAFRSRSPASRTLVTNAK